MALRPLIASLLCSALVCQVVAADSASAGKLSGLVTNSPFGTGRSGAVNGGSNGEPFEFRAVVEENGNKFFSIYETATKRSNWVEVNDPVNGFSVKGYDAGKETITIDYQGKAMTLAIKRAPAVAQVMQQPMTLPAPNGMPQTGNNPSAQAMPGPSAVDQQRIQQIQEEIRRRRALRNQSALPGAGNGPQPMSQPSSGGPVPQASMGEGPVPRPATSNGP